MRYSLFCDVTQRWLVVTDVSPIFKGQTAQDDWANRLSENVGNYQPTLCKILEERVSYLQRSVSLTSLTARRATHKPPRWVTYS
jgi:hypothetical protein